MSSVRVLRPCGTLAAYSRHLRHGEIACDLCKRAVRGASRNHPSRAHRKPKKSARCGTSSGFQRHKRLGESPCSDCREAFNSYRREKRTGSAAKKELASCGSRAAYLRHIRKGETPCNMCKQANADARRNRRNPRRHWWSLWVEQGGMCPLCRNLFPCGGVSVHVDHIIPISANGKHVRENLQLTHDYCNLIKGDRDNDWAIQVLS